MAALGQSLLQELNGRNAVNPLSHLIAERLYLKTGFAGANGKKRYLRADLHLNLKPLRLGTKRLSGFGWRHSNWIEAKFFRRPRSGASPTTSNAGHIIADLVRLVALVPIEKAKEKDADGDAANAEAAADGDGGNVVHQRLYSGRYLLHVYDGEPENLLAFSRNKTKYGNAGERNWLKELIEPGEHKISDFELDQEGNSFITPLNRRLEDTELTLNVTNFVVKPVAGASSAKTAYWCVLTRIDSFSISVADFTWEVDADRQGKESAAGAYEAIRDHVGKYVHLAAGEDQPPDDDELDVDDIEDSDDEDS